jgi:hypothetical protein
MNNMLTATGRKEFQATAYSVAEAILSFCLCTWFADWGAVDCPPRASPLAGPEVSGSPLPDSIMVGRTGLITSDFGLREFDTRGALVCPTPVSSFAGFALAKGVETGVLALFEAEPSLTFTGSARTCFRRSAASAPAIRICSIVSLTEPDFIPSLWGLASVDVPGPEPLFSEAGVGCAGAFDFASRATTTSCERISPTRTKPQRNAVKSFVCIKALS